MFVDISVSVLVLIAALFCYKYAWLNNKFSLFERWPAAYENPNNLPFWYVGDTCRYRRRK